MLQQMPIWMLWPISAMKWACLPWQLAGDLGQKLAWPLNMEGRRAAARRFKPNEGIKALELALTQNNPHLAIVDMDWESVSPSANFS